MTFGPIRTERLLLGPVGRTSRGTAARAEIGHSLAPAVWGPGYATNTVAAVCARMLEDAKITRLNGVASPLACLI
ncbi:GNAT family N-acetyltransferase [Ilumatobacter sp.]|jgi:RimJ/RimL family protein N-acetyltransferase|uniref:GNAT family N-acetyltransferase n=1 Tax=Ilumatobacter sp. TaxID=1967498 RepID=UPI0037519E75